MIPERVDKILQFALARAAQEDFENRELGPIHLLKLVYLADTEYAATHEGNTFTEVPWRFHHFGPWDFPAYERIAPVMAQIGAKARPVLSVRYESETTFWSLDPWDAVTGRLYESLDSELPAPMTRAVTRAIHEYGRDTSGLLDFVYKTPPMTIAAPGDILDFSCMIRGLPPAIDSPPSASVEAPTSLSRKQKHAAQEKKRALLEKLRKTRVDGPRPGCVVPPAAPVDEILSQGVHWLDSLAGEPLPEIMDGILEFDPSVWRSDMRTPSGLS